MDARGRKAAWRSDGKELFYAASNGQLMAVDVREGTTGPEVGLPTTLFEIADADPVSDYYAVSADGQRFLVRVPVETDRKLQMHVVLNWESVLESGE